MSVPSDIGTVDLTDHTPIAAGSTRRRAADRPRRRGLSAGSSMLFPSPRPDRTFAMATKMFSDKEMEELRQRLVEERGQLEEQYHEIEESSFSANQSEITGEMTLDEEYADAGTA